MCLLQIAKDLLQDMWGEQAQCLANDTDKRVDRARSKEIHQTGESAHVNTLMVQVEKTCWHKAAAYPEGSHGNRLFDGVVA